LDGHLVENIFEYPVLSNAYLIKFEKEKKNLEILKEQNMLSSREQSPTQMLSPEAIRLGYSRRNSS
jgi:hypothetical protein